jgi:large subunit ribosomal protein L34
MHLKIRVSSLKHRKKTGFRRRMRTKGGRAVISRQRRAASGKGKRR